MEHIFSVIGLLTIIVVLGIAGRYVFGWVLYKSGFSK